MEADTQNKLLIYWSGEADESQSLEAEALLEANEEARRYLDELGELEAFRDDLAERAVSTPSRAFAAEAVAGHLAEKKVARRQFMWIGAAAAAVTVLIAIVLESWSPGDTARDLLADEEVHVLEVPGVNPATPRPKLSERLFVTRPYDSTSDRITAARDRARQLRSNLHQPNPSPSRL